MTLKERTLAHYKRMIEWVEKQDPDDTPSLAKIFVEIGENWQAYCCPLCGTYYRCHGCPIAKDYKGCEGTPWDKLANADTWKEWLEGAKEEVAFIKSLDF